MLSPRPLVALCLLAACSSQPPSSPPAPLPLAPCASAPPVTAAAASSSAPPRTEADVARDAADHFAHDGPADDDARAAEKVLAQWVTESTAGRAMPEHLECRAHFCSLTLLFESQRRAEEWLGLTARHTFPPGRFPGTLFPPGEQLPHGGFRVQAYFDLRPGPFIAAPLRP